MVRLAGRRMNFERIELLPPTITFDICLA